MNGNLEGYLVGYGIEHRDGSIDETWLKEPKHNTITKHMLNNLLMYNGSNALTTNWSDNAALWVSAGGTRTGVLNYGAYGDGNAATTTNDIALKNKRSEYSSTKKTGAPYCGSYANSRTGVFSLRVTYQFAAATEDIVVRELGIFHKVEPSGNYSLTARVVPDKPIAVLTGDTFYFTYQLNISFEHSYVYKNIDGNGMDLKKVLNVWFYRRDNSDYQSTDEYGACFPGVKTTGVGGLANTGSSGESTNGCRAKAPIYGLNTTYRGYYNYYLVGNVAYPYTNSFSLPPTSSYFASTITADPNAYVNGYVHPKCCWPIKTQKNWLKTAFNPQTP